MVPLKTCEWCKQPLNNSDGRVKYHKINDHGVHCQTEAKREKTRLRKRKYAKKHPEEQEARKRKNYIEKKGTFQPWKYKIDDLQNTTYLGVIIVPNIWALEYTSIRRHQDEIGVTYYSENKYRNFKVPRTTGYKGVTYEDLSNFNITYQLENSGPCPICGDNHQDKDITRCELICRNTECPGDGGLVVRGTQYGINYPPNKAKMAVTAQDITTASTLQQKGKDVSPQDIAWTRFFE